MLSFDPSAWLGQHLTEPEVGVGFLACAAVSAWWLCNGWQTGEIWMGAWLKPKRAVGPAMFWLAMLCQAIFTASLGLLGVATLMGLVQGQR